MYIQQLPSGSWRIRENYKGKTYSITVKDKPSNRQASALINAKINEGTFEGLPESFGTAALSFLEDCSKRKLSPATIRGYTSIYNNVPEDFKRLRIDRIQRHNVQDLIDLYSRTHAPKSTRSMSSFVLSVIKKNRSFNYSFDLPQAKKKIEYEPTTEDIKRIIERSKGTRYYLFIRLAALGLRRGEIACLTSQDIDKKNVLTINKSLVLDENNTYQIKPSAKTEASNRRILIPSDIADDLRSQERVFDGNPHTINETLHKFQDDLDIPRFRLHIMRHFAAAYLLKKKNFTVPQIEDYMGWEHGSSVMKKVYSYNLDPHESQKDIADAFSDLF